MKAAALAVAGLVAVGAGLVVWRTMVAPPEEQAPGGIATQGQQAPAASSPRPTTSDAAPSLIDIAATRPDAARNRALYDLLADADWSRIEDLLRQVRDLPASPRRTDIVRILYIHLASINPAAAADHVLDARHQPSWLAAVFRVWAHTDFDAAVHRAGSLDGRLREVVARTLLEMDLPDWQEEAIAEELQAARLVAEVRAYRALKSGTPQQAWVNALAMPAGAERNRRLDLAAQAWAKDDPAGALLAISEIGSDAGRWMSSRVLADWARSDHAAALRWLSEQDGSDQAKSQASMLARAIAASGIDTALSKLQEMPPWAQQSAKTAILQHWLDADLPAAIDWLGSLSLADQQWLGYLAARSFVRHDAEQAFRWAMAADPRIRERILQSVVREIGNAQMAERLFRRIESPDIKSDLASTLYHNYAPENPTDALRWADTFEPAMRERFRSLAYSNWAERDPDGAIRDIRQYRDPVLRDQAAADVIDGLLIAFNAAAAERLFPTIRTPEVRRRAAFALYFYFTRTDANPDKAAAYDAITSRFGDGT